MKVTLDVDRNGCPAFVTSDQTSDFDIAVRDVTATTSNESTLRGFHHPNGIQLAESKVSMDLPTDTEGKAWKINEA
jgi:hypothetical protein